MSHCLFNLSKPYVVRSKRLFVLPGEIIEGELRPGMQLSLPLNDSLTITAPIDSIEDIRHGDRSEVGVCIAYTDAAELELWQSMDLGDEDLIFTEADEHGG